MFEFYNDWSLLVLSGCEFNTDYLNFQTNILWLYINFRVFVDDWTIDDHWRSFAASLLQLNIVLNPGSSSSPPADGDLLHVRAVGDNDTLHFLFCSLGAPTLLLIHTNTSLSTVKVYLCVWCWCFSLLIRSGQTDDPCSLLREPRCGIMMTVMCWSTLGVWRLVLQHCRWCCGWIMYTASIHVLWICWFSGYLLLKLKWLGGMQPLIGWYVSLFSLLICCLSQVNWTQLIDRNNSGGLEVEPKSSILYSTAIVFSRVRSINLPTSLFLL